MRTSITRGTTALLVFLAACGGDGGGSTNPTPTPTITVSAAQPTLALAQGQSGTVALTLTRGGQYAGTVALATAGAPAGVTATLTPSSLSGTSATSALAIATTSAVAPGTYAISIVGSGANVASSTTTVSLVVSAATPGTSALTVATGGTGTGTVTSAPNGIACPGTCSASFPTGSTITLTATPTNGGTFTGWSGGCTGATATCTVTLATATSATASFAAAAPAGFSIAVAPATVAVAQGASATVQATIARTSGFAGTVSLATTGAPNGLTVTPNPATTSGTTSTLTIAAGAATAPGTYTITLTGTSGALAPQAATFAVQVTPAATGGNVVYDFAGCDAISTPIWLAAQDGSGAWTRIVPDARGAYRFTLATRGGVAYVTRDGGTYALDVTYASAAEHRATGAGSQCASAPRGTKRLTGTVAGVGPQDFVTVAMGSASSNVFGALGSTFTLDSVASGARDLIAARATLSDAGFVPSRLIVRRGLDYAATIPTLDFASSEAFAPTAKTITLGGIGGDGAFGAVSYVTPNGASAAFHVGEAVGASLPFYGVPASKQMAGDLHELAVFAIPAATGAQTSSRMLFTFFRDAADRTVTLSAPLGQPTVTSAAARPRAQLPSQTEYADFASATFSQSDRAATVSASAAYFGGTPATWTLDVPDLSAVPGFDASWMLRAGMQASWSVTAFGGDVLAMNGGAPTDGAQVRAASRSGSAAALQASLRSLNVGRLPRR